MSNAPAAKVAPGAQAADAIRPLVRIVIVGHVDHGKSTLIGRLIHDTGSLPDGKLEAIKAMSDRRGMPFEWSFLLDALQAERDQGITIDTSQIAFKTPSRDVVLIDAPGHVEFLKNMVTGAAQADAAILVVDAEEGVREQTRRHGYLLHLLGVGRVVVVVNKMDRIGWNEAGFRAIETELGDYLRQLGLAPDQFIAASARDGVNIATDGDAPAWAKGATLVGAIDGFVPAVETGNLPLRLPVQDVYKFDDRRIVAGRVESGRLRLGDELVFSPSGKVARVRSIESWPQPQKGKALTALHAGQSYGITLDREIFVERGEVASHPATAPAAVRNIHARIFWLSELPLAIGSRVTLKLATAEVPARLAAIKAVVDTSTLDSAARPEIGRNQVAEVTFQLQTPIAVDTADTNPRLGRFVLESERRISGGGIVIALGEAGKRLTSSNISPVDSEVTEGERAAANGHRGAVIWLTGLPSAGKSTIAKVMERRLFDRGRGVILLDGDTLRAGLNGDLGFTPEDRSENVRRTGEVAALLARNGMIALVALVSPSASDRKAVRESAGQHFHEVFVKASVETCAKRDPKGLYARARAGGIAQFTGVSAGYEVPGTPELIIDTEVSGLAESVAVLEAYLDQSIALSKERNG